MRNENERMKGAVYLIYKLMRLKSVDSKAVDVSKKLRYRLGSNPRFISNRKLSTIVLNPGTNSHANWVRGLADSGTDDFT